MQQLRNLKIENFSEEGSLRGGFAKVLNQTLSASAEFGWRWGGYHEIFVAANLKRISYNIVEFRQYVAKSGGLGATDIDIVATRLNSTNGQTDKFFFQAKSTVRSYAAGKSDLYTNDFDGWLKAAKTNAAGWNAKAKSLDGEATRIWVHSDGQDLPGELSNFILDLGGLADRIDWPSL